MNKKITTKQIVITGLLLALEIIFQILGNYLQFGPVNINISLVTVVLAAVICGPLFGAILGFFNGIMVLFSPSTLAIFMSMSPVGTIITCLTKCTLAGLISGLVFKVLKNKNQLLGLILASALVPIINTGLFSMYCFIFFRPLLQSCGAQNFGEMMSFLIVSIITINFLIELPLTIVLSTTSGMALLKRKQD